MSIRRPPSTRRNSRSGALLTHHVDEAEHSGPDGKPTEISDREAEIARKQAAAREMLARAFREPDAGREAA